MAIRITIAPDEDPASAPERTLQIDPVHMGYKPDLNYDSIESLIEHGKGEQPR
jgi:hypothetical protein